MRRREMMSVSLGTVIGLASRQSAPGALGSKPAALTAHDGELVYVGRDPVRIKVSPAGAKGRFAMITQDVSPATSIPVHAHDYEDEIIFIQSGQGEATLGTKTVQLAAGSTLFVPQGTWHGGRNTGSEIMKWIAIYSRGSGSVTGNNFSMRTYHEDLRADLSCGPPVRTRREDPP